VSDGDAVQPGRARGGYKSVLLIAEKLLYVKKKMLQRKYEEKAAA